MHFKPADTSHLGLRNKANLPSGLNQPFINFKQINFQTIIQASKSKGRFPAFVRTALKRCST